MYVTYETNRIYHDGSLLLRKQYWVLRRRPGVRCNIAEHRSPECGSRPKVCDMSIMERVKAAVDHDDGSRQTGQIFPRHDHP